MSAANGSPPRIGPLRDVRPEETISSDVGEILSEKWTHSLCPLSKTRCASSGRGTDGGRRNAARNPVPRDAIFSAPPDFHRTGLSSRGYYAGAEKMAPYKRCPLTGVWIVERRNSRAAKWMRIPYFRCASTLSHRKIRLPLSSRNQGIFVIRKLSLATCEIPLVTAHSLPITFP